MFKNHQIHVERAKFEMKGNYDPNKGAKPKRRNKNKDKKLMEKQRQKLLGWDESEVQRGKHEKVVVIKGLFDLNNVSVKKLKKIIFKEYKFCFSVT
jgi:HIV Tat-specific factor 1